MPPGIVPTTTAIPPGVLPTEAPVSTPAHLRLQRLRQQAAQVSPGAASMEPADLGVTDPFADPFFTADEPAEPPDPREGIWPSSFGEAIKGRWRGDVAKAAAPDLLGQMAQTFMPWAGFLPDPAREQRDVQESWYALSPDVRKKLFMESFTDVQGATAGRIPLGDIPTDFNSVFTRKAMNALDVGTRPIDAFAEATYQSFLAETGGTYNPVESFQGIDPSHLIDFMGDLFSDPSKLIDEEY